MLGLLKYRTKSMTGQDQQDAADALDLYQTLDPSEKKSFLGHFPDNKVVKQKGAIGQAVASYKRTMSFTKSAEAAVAEDFYTRCTFHVYLFYIHVYMPGGLLVEEASYISNRFLFSVHCRHQIMEFNGLKFSDFSKEEAIELSDSLVADNKAEYGHDGKCQEHDKFWQLTKFWYVRSLGVKRSRKLEGTHRIDAIRSGEAEVREGFAAIMGQSGSSSLGVDDVKVHAG